LRFAAALLAILLGFLFFFRGPLFFVRHNGFPLLSCPAGGRGTDYYTGCNSAAQAALPLAIRLAQAMLWDLR
jgi:hypothetical protein